MSKTPIVEEDATPDPYPQFQDEVFQMYEDDMIAPDDIPDKITAKAYQEWLNKK